MKTLCLITLTVLVAATAGAQHATLADSLDALTDALVEVDRINAASITVLTTLRGSAETEELIRDTLLRVLSASVIAGFPKDGMVFWWVLDPRRVVDLHAVKDGVEGQALYDALTRLIADCRIGVLKEPWSPVPPNLIAHRLLLSNETDSAVLSIKEPKRLGGRHLYMLFLGDALRAMQRQAKP